jgi:hypothetical protein
VFDGPIARFRHKIDIACKSVICGALAVATGLVACGFLCAAAFVWIGQSHGTIVACLALGGAFVVFAAVALIVAMMLRRRKAPSHRSQPMWSDDPAMSAAIGEIMRGLGGRRMTSAALVSAFGVGLTLSRSARPREK